MPGPALRASGPVPCSSTAGLLSILLVANAAWGQREPVPVAVAAVESREVHSTRSFAGTVMPLRSSVVGSAVDGRVEAFLIDEGDRVTQGQPLARLRTRLLEIQIAGAKAELELRRHELAELKNGSRPEEIAQAKAKAGASEALYNYHRGRLQRAEALRNQPRAISEDEMQEATSATESALQTLLESKAALELALAGPRRERIQQAEARVAFAQEAIHELEDQLDKHTIVAPFDGYVVEENTEVGQWVTRGQAVAKVVELGQVDVQSLVLEDYQPLLALGMEAVVRLDALPNRQFTGRIALVVPQADLRSRSFPVKVRLDNQDTPGGPLLKPGMLARVALAVGDRVPALLVPKDALVLGGEKPYVVAAEGAAGAGQAGKARLVPVDAGASTEGLIQIKPLGELKAGDFVIVEGNERVRPGQEVLIAKVVEAPAARTAAAPTEPAPTARTGPQRNPGDAH
jgi:RND family efflux transporter MFP subunit